MRVCAFSELIFDLFHMFIVKGRDRSFFVELVPDLIHIVIILFLFLIKDVDYFILLMIASRSLKVSVLCPLARGWIKHREHPSLQVVIVYCWIVSLKVIKQVLID
mmetsp:Transcript_561/g.612  ORF Transcript_561/g.612 Transcript_561/m.612 type:complete len:105 (-) Transcript_561:771-1085(-)